MTRRRLNENNYIAWVIDASGSMAGQKQVAAIEGLQGKTLAIKTESVAADEQGLKTLVGLWSFRNEVQEHYTNVNGLEVEPLPTADYNCTGGTALYDGVKAAIDWFKENTDVDDERNSYLIETITDGGENASRCNKNDLAEEVQQLQGTGRWSFTIAGPDNHDNQQFVERLQIPEGNVAFYEAQTAEGTRLAYVETAGKLRGFMKGRTRGVKSVTAFHSDQEGVTADYRGIKPMQTVEDAFERYTTQSGTAKGDLSLDDLLARAHNLVDQLPDVPPEQELRDRADKWLKEITQGASDVEN